MPLSREAIIRLTLILVSVVITYLVCEAFYRVYVYAQLLNNTPETSLPYYWTLSQPLWQFDEQAGYGYIPNSDVDIAIYQDSQVQSRYSIHINNIGNVARRDVTSEKAPGEYRIAFLGDSLTASVTTTTQWVTLVEKALNQDEALKAQTGIRQFTTLNFGLDGTGIVQFTGLYQPKVAAYQPDMVVANFIYDDPTRDFVYRDTVRVDDDFQITLLCKTPPIDLNNPECQVTPYLTTTIADPQQHPAVFRTLYQQRVASLEWFTPQPLLLSRLLNSPVSIASPQIRMAGAMPRLSPDEGVQRSSEAFSALRSQHPNVVILYNVLPPEIVSNTVSDANVLRLMEATPGILSMLDYLPEANGDEIDRWFLSDGHHWSDYGAEIYAEAVSQAIREFVTPQL